MTDRPTLPPGVARSDEPIADPDALERAGRSMLDLASRGIVEGVRAHGAEYVVRASAALLDAWGRLEPEPRRRLEADIAKAATAAAATAVADLERLFSSDPHDQRATPLQIVRRLVAPATSLLAEAGIPAIERDEFEVRALPHDHYGLAPRALGDLGDPDLTPLLVAWGVGKSNVIRARAARRQR